MILSFSILFIFLLLGQAISHGAGLAVPGNVLGMLLLTVALLTGCIKEVWVKPGADFLLNHMAFLFVPAGVGIMEHFELISANWAALLTLVAVTTLITMAVTAYIQQALEKRQ